MSHRTFAAVAMIVTAFGLTAALAVPASAAPATSATGTLLAAAANPLPCGYDGYHGGGQPLYNHCGNTDVVLEVDHMFWQTTYDCVAPGVRSTREAAAGPSTVPNGTATCAASPVRSSGRNIELRLETARALMHGQFPM